MEVPTVGHQIRRRHHHPHEQHEQEHTRISNHQNTSSSSPYGHNHNYEEAPPPENLSVIWSIITLLTRSTTILLSFLCTVGLFTLLSLLYLTIRPFSRAWYRKLVCTLAATSYLDALALLLPNVKICLTGDSDVPCPIGVSVLLSNHVMERDWWILLMLGRSIGLRGSMKVFLRREILFGNSNSNNDESSELYSTVMKFALNQLLEFPSLSSECGNSYIKDRDELFDLLRGFAEEGWTNPVQFLLFPEGFLPPPSSSSSDFDSSGNHTNSSSSSLIQRRKARMAKSVEFAKREGRPQLKHLLLPRTTGFNASLESLRVGSPVVYDVTMAYQGYDGNAPLSIFDLSWSKILHLFTTQQQHPNKPIEVHIRIKKYSIEEVLKNSNWLDQKWAEKDVLLHHFSQRNCFPHHVIDNRGFCKFQTFNTKYSDVGGSLLGLIRLGVVMPFCVPPFLLFLGLPLGWVLFCVWCVLKVFQGVWPEENQKMMHAAQENENGQNHNSVFWRIFTLLMGENEAQHDINSNGSNPASASAAASSSRRNDRRRSPDDPIRRNDDDDDDDSVGRESNGNESVEGGGDGTPYLPATPFASPLTNWETSPSKSSS